MKSLHLVYSFPPDPIGGTEVYVAQLCRDLIASGDDAVVVAPAARDAEYLHDGLRVRRFAVDQAAISIESVYGDGDEAAADAFGAILASEKPDVVHQHALTAACSVVAAARVKAAGVPLVFTYHTPTVTCTRGTLLEWGERECDGRVDVDRCTACTLHAHGAGRWASRTLARVPAAVGRATRTAGLGGGVWTAMQMRALMERRASAIRHLIGLVDRFVVLTPWVEGLLLANEVPADRLVTSAHGVPTASIARHEVTQPSTDRPVRLVHLGRLDPVKGTHLLIQAMRRLPAAPLTLDIFGIVQSADQADALTGLAREIESDSRIRLLPPIAPQDVITRLADYDYVVVPSQWLETGPLVALEALAAGTPVVASALGGLADKVVDGRTGVLVSPFASLEAWTAALHRVAASPSLHQELARQITTPRSSRDVAAEMHRVYEALTSATTPQACHA